MFVRLRLGSATQFTHPRPSAMPAVSWQQDFVFVGVPLKPHPFHARFQSSNYPLIVEVWCFDLEKFVLMGRQARKLTRINRPFAFVPCFVGGSDRLLLCR